MTPSLEPADSWHWDSDLHCDDAPLLFVSPWDGVSSSPEPVLQDPFSTPGVRLGPGKFSLTRYWPIPLYAVAFIIHKRYRAGNPRRLPTLSSLRLPELYGTLALGHLADIEADRLLVKLVRDGDTHRMQIEVFFQRLRWTYNDYLYLLTESDTSDLSRLIYPFSGGKETTLMDLFQFARWELRIMWSTEDVRALISFLILPHVLKVGLDLHDMGVLVSFLSEYAVKNGFHHKPSTLHEEPLWEELVGWTITAIFHRCTEPHGYLSLLYNGCQRCLFYLLAYRIFGSQYTHYSSLWGLKHPAKAAEVVRLTSDSMEEISSKGRWY